MLWFQPFCFASRAMRLQSDHAKHATQTKCLSRCRCLRWLACVWLRWPRTPWSFVHERMVRVRAASVYALAPEEPDRHLCASTYSHVRAHACMLCLRLCMRSGSGMYVRFAFGYVSGLCIAFVLVIVFWRSARAFVLLRFVCMRFRSSIILSRGFVS